MPLSGISHRARCRCGRSGWPQGSKHFGESLQGGAAQAGLTIEQAQLNLSREAAE